MKTGYKTSEFYLIVITFICSILCFFGISPISEPLNGVIGAVMMIASALTYLHYRYKLKAGGYMTKEDVVKQTIYTLYGIGQNGINPQDMEIDYDAEWVQEVQDILAAAAEDDELDEDEDDYIEDEDDDEE